MLERLGKYEILETIAAGGQGTVYRARDSGSGDVVALRQEANLASRLDHPNIVKVFDFQVEGGTAYVAMEYVPGVLRGEMQPGTPISPGRAVELAIQVCGAMAHAHQHGVVHRDIKPQNILLTEDGTVKVSDFGVARALASSTRSRTGSIMGTPQYMAPEQWESGRLDGRLDQYALGIVLYEMLTGTLPFQGESMAALFVQHREAPVPPIPGHLDVPRAVEDVVRRALEKSPEDRFADAEAMATALEAALTGAANREQRPAQTPVEEIPAAAPPEPQPQL